MKGQQVLFSKASDHWETPKHIYKRFKELGYIDPCPLHSKTDNLVTKWESNVFINPPYSNIMAWVDKTLYSRLETKIQAVLLVPSRTDTRWFHKAIDNGGKVHFIKRRLRFNESGSAPFPSILISFGTKAHQHCKQLIVEWNRD